MTPERAKELLKHGNTWPHIGEYMQLCTCEEKYEIEMLWDTMPGNTSRYSAICRLAYPEINKNG